MARENTATILLVDDEDYFRQRMRRAFERRGFTVYEAADAHEALAQIGRHCPAMAVVDLRMPGKSGLELVKEAMALEPGLRVVVLTGYGSIATATEAIRSGAVNYLAKPADVDDILAALEVDADTRQDVLPPEEIPTPSLARAEWEHINRVLSDCNGNISAAAKRLHIHRRTLQRKLAKYAPNK